MCAQKFAFLQQKYALRGLEGHGWHACSAHLCCAGIPHHLSVWTWVGCSDYGSHKAAEHSCISTGIALRIWTAWQDIDSGVSEHWMRCGQRISQS